MYLQVERALRVLLGITIVGLSVSVWADYPVTMEHKFGSITITEKPSRVVSIGISDQDDILAFGVTPVAIRDWYGNKPFATWPWAQDELGDAQPVVLSSGDLDFEQIAALKPDLIIGISSGMSAEDYEKLSLLAPTLAQSADYIEWGMPWQERTQWIGKALDKEQMANTIISRLESRISSVPMAHPDFKGKSAAVAFYYSGQPGAYASSDLRSRLLEQMGFIVPSEYDEIAGSSFYASFSEEQLELLDVDVLLWLPDVSTLEAVGVMPLRKHMPFYKQGREVFLGDLLGGAFSFMTPLSIDYLLDNLVSEIELALDGDPATVVPSSISQK